MSMLWWGIYVGVPGAVLCAMIGMLAERPAGTPASAPEAKPPVPVARAVPLRRSPDPAADLQVSASRTADEVIIHISGVAGVNQSGALLSGLLAASACRPSVVTLDLSDLRFLSSIAMGVLMTYRRGVVRAGGRVRLAELLQPEVREALARVGLCDLFEATADAEAALSR
jgi:anti-anti-sigma factor